MRLNAPKKNTWTAALIFGLIAFIAQVLTYFMDLPYVPVISFWIMTLAFLLLLLGAYMKGL